MFLRNVGRHSTDYTGVISQMIVLFTTTAVRTSNPTTVFLIYFIHQGTQMIICLVTEEPSRCFHITK
jgi:LytS/YehU family sensor histidine kinase